MALPRSASSGTLSTVLAALSRVRASLPEVYWLVWLGTLVNRAGSFVLPMLGYYLIEERGLSRGTAVAIATCHGAGMLTAGLVGGVLADRLGRRATMVLSLFGGAAMLVVLGELRAPVAIGVAGYVLGVVGDLYRPAVMAFVTDVVEPRDRHRAYAYLYWAINLGFAIAPLAAGALAGWSYRALFLIDAATMAIYGVIIWRRVGESRPAPAADAAPVHLGAVLTDRVFMVFVGLCLTQGLMFHQSTVVLSLHVEGLGYAAATYGAMVAVNGILIVLIQPLVSRWAEGRASAPLLAAASLACGWGMALHAVTALPAQFAAVAIWTTGEILQSPFFATTVSTLAPASARGRYQGVFGTTFGLAAMAAPSAGQAAVDGLGPSGPWLLCAGLGTVAAGLYLATAAGRRARGVA